MSEPTPRPWKAWRQDGDAELWCVNHSDGNYVVDIADDMRHANAEFIVRACNSFDELVAALEGVLAGFDAQVFVRNTAGDDDPSWAIKLVPHLKALAAAQAALARARGTES